MIADFLAREAEHHLLALRELLVRFDENEKAHDLMQAAPYWIAERPAVRQAREDQAEMTAHARDPETYAAYYADNPHERPFEQQYGIAAERAHEHLYRVHFLRQGLAAEERRDPDPSALSMVDLSANDGWLAENLAQLGYTVDCVDLNAGCVARARERKQREPRIGAIDQADFTRFTLPDYDVVVLFETIEHVPDVERALDVACGLVRPGGTLYISTPDGAVEGGNLPEWDRVERKGHLRAIPAAEFRALLEPLGEVEAFEVGPDRVACARVRMA